MGRDFPTTKTEDQYPQLHRTEIVGADDFMPVTCWTRYFVQAQGYRVQDTIIFHDNGSAILLEKNG
jgi:hypothetical protein